MGKVTRLHGDFSQLFQHNAGMSKMKNISSSSWAPTHDNKWLGDQATGTRLNFPFCSKGNSQTHYMIQQPGHTSFLLSLPNSRIPKFWSEE